MNDDPNKSEDERLGQSAADDAAGSSPTSADDVSQLAAVRGHSPAPPPAEEEDAFSHDDDFTHPVEDEFEHAEFTDDDMGDEEAFTPTLELPQHEVDDTVEDVSPLELDPDEVHVPTDEEMDWYILKVQSNRENSVASTLQRRVKLAGLDPYFDQIMVPVEKVTEFKSGKKKVVKRKKYPGYIVVRMALNDETWFLVRETAGIGDFTGSAGRPSPMLPSEVAQIVEKPEEKGGQETARLDIPFNLGDRVKINEGTFENFEGDVDVIDTTNGRVTVMINIFGRSVPVELEHWQIAAV